MACYDGTNVKSLKTLKLKVYCRFGVFTLYLANGLLCWDELPVQLSENPQSCLALAKLPAPILVINFVFVCQKNCMCFGVFNLYFYLTASSII